MNNKLPKECVLSKKKAFIRTMDSVKAQTQHKKMFIISVAA